MINDSRVIADIETVERFRAILYYEIRISAVSIVLFYLVARFGSIFIIIGVFIIAAILFTPYIFYVLIKERHYEWIAVFFLMIIIPLISAFIIFKETIAFETILLLSLLSFYIYCFLIKYAVDEWIRKYYWTKQLEEQKKAREQRRKDEMQW